MHNIQSPDQPGPIADLLREMPPAEWVREMVEHYRRTGAYRPEDLRRLLGDPTKGVEVGPNASLASHFSAATIKQP